MSNNNTNNVHSINEAEALNNKKKLGMAQIKNKAYGKTANHQKIVDAIHADKKTINFGAAGTGKTFIPLNIGLQQVASGKYDQVIIYRSAVGVRDDGFLPGDDRKKIEPFEEPYMQIVQETFDVSSNEAYYWLKEKINAIAFRSTRFNQGITTYRKFMIVDEAQNMTYKELFNLLTRLGEGSTIHFCGDFKKQDFLPEKEKSGFKLMIDVIKSSQKLMDQFEITQLTPSDVMRNDFVKDFIIADYDYFS
tara:strand:- start:2873 stop:3619 length:747 start_codon:yes stop_codon:yes gene_type:complete